MTEPLVWATQHALFALDPETGELRWRYETSKLRRIFRLDDRLFVLTAAGVDCVDVATGHSIGRVPLGFTPTAGVHTGDRLFVAGPDGAAALTTTGEILWSAKHEHAKGFSLKSFYACARGDGTEMWRQECTSPSRYANPGLVLGDQVAQPDIDSQ